MDFARHDSPKVQAQLDRLAVLSLPQGRIGLDAIRALLGRVGNPQLGLPPVFHVAGTNGKGSVCAFLLAIMQAEGLRVHATISPHLVRYNERIRIAGHLIDDEHLAALLKEVLDAADDLPVSFFETTIAASFLAFAREPADACIIEVGLGGRFDATNVIESPAACGIATLGIDHERFLLAPEDGTPTEPLARIAFEKAGIAKPGAPLVTQAYPPSAELEIKRAAHACGALLHMRGEHWDAGTVGPIEYRDRQGAMTLPMPVLPGAHQADNAALAVAMLRHQSVVSVSRDAMAAGIRVMRWPARLQRLGDGPLLALAGAREVWLDGGHNPDAGAALARYFTADHQTGSDPVSTPAGGVHLIIGMLDNKNPRALTDPLGARIASLSAVPIVGHPHHPTSAFGSDAVGFSDVPSALDALPDDGLPVLIAGSLYLAGEVLRLNGEFPD